MAFPRNSTSYNIALKKPLSYFSNQIVQLNLSQRLLAIQIIHYSAGHSRNFIKYLLRYFEKIYKHKLTAITYLRSSTAYDCTCNVIIHWITDHLIRSPYVFTNLCLEGFCVHPVQPDVIRYCLPCLLQNPSLRPKRHQIQIKIIFDAF